MRPVRTIEIDFDVHKCIENERRGFDESPNDALRRLLKLGEAKPPATIVSSAPSPARRSWSNQGVVLPHGTAIRMSYSGCTYQGQIINGAWVIGNQTFASPSGAASGVAVTKKGKTTRLDGWIYWEVKPPGNDGWTSIASLRPKASLVSPFTAEKLGL